MYNYNVLFNCGQHYNVNYEFMRMADILPKTKRSLILYKIYQSLKTKMSAGQNKGIALLRKNSNCYFNVLSRFLLHLKLMWHCFFRALSISQPQSLLQNS